MAFGFASSRIAPDWLFFAYLFFSLAWLCLSKFFEERECRYCFFLIMYPLCSREEQYIIISTNQEGVCLLMGDQVCSKIQHALPFKPLCRERTDILSYYFCVRAVRTDKTLLRTLLIASSFILLTSIISLCLRIVHQITRCR